MHRHYSFILKEKASAVDGTNALTVVTVVVVRVGIARIEVEVATVSGIARIKRRRPVVAVRALIVERSAIPVARGGQKRPTVCEFTNSSLLACILYGVSQRAREERHHISPARLRFTSARKIMLSSGDLLSMG